MTVKRVGESQPQEWGIVDTWYVNAAGKRTGRQADRQTERRRQCEVLNSVSFSLFSFFSSLSRIRFSCLWSSVSSSSISLFFFRFSVCSSSSPCLHFFTSSRLHFFTSSLLHFFTSSLLHLFTSSLLRFFTASLLHCFTASLLLRPRCGAWSWDSRCGDVLW